MKKRSVEQAALMFSIAKWTALATLTGVLVGTVTAWFLKTLTVSIDAIQHLARWYFLLPVGGLLCGWLIH